MEDPGFLDHLFNDIDDRARVLNEGDKNMHRQSLRPQEQHREPLIEQLERHQQANTAVSDYVEEVPPLDQLILVPE